MLKSFIVGALVSVAAVAQAAPVIYFGENQTPGTSVSGAPVSARATFLAALSGVSSEGFESFSDGDFPPLNLSFTGSAGPIGAVLTGASGIIENNAGGIPDGRFNTTGGGSLFFEIGGTFDIEFGTPISAFGFYGTDIGDFNGQLTLALTDTGGNVSTLLVPHTVNGANASLLFYGFIDAAAAYTRVSFGTTSGTDFFGFDDMIIGDRAQIGNPGGTVPEPGSLALVGISLLGLAASRRSKRAA